MHTRSERLVASAPRWRLRMRALTLLTVLLMLAVFMIGWLRPATPLPPSALSLQDFRVTLPAVVVAGIGDDLSGITHDGDHDRLLAITNSGPEQLLVLDRQGSLLAQHALIGFKDTEDLAWLGDGNNVLHSILEAAGIFKFNVRVATPAGFEPEAAFVEAARAGGAWGRCGGEGGGGEVAPSLPSQP